MPSEFVHARPAPFLYSPNRRSNALVNCLASESPPTAEPPVPHTHRNDPCPCGSGKKFKRCHGQFAGAAHHGLSVADGGLTQDSFGPSPTPRREARWEVDLLPLPISIGTDPDARPVMLLVMGDGYVLHQQPLNQPPSDPVEVAGILLRGVRAVVDRVGFWPPVLAVRTPALAAAAGSVPARIEAGPLPEFDDASRGLLAFLGPGLEDRPLGLSSPETWKGWGLSAGMIADLFGAAAEYYRARPWRTLADDDLLRAACPTGNQWTVCILGNGGVEFGLALYGDPDDVERQFMATDPRHAMSELRGMVLSLTFGRRDDLPKVMRKEILAAGWTVAGPEAYPLLMALNTPGGGVTATQMADLRDILRAAGPVAQRFEAEIQSAEPEAFTWTDSGSGVTLSLISPPFLETDLWPLPITLSPALPTGPSARPAAALEHHDPEALRQGWQGLLIRFHHQLHQELAPATALRHARNVVPFLSFLAEVEEIPVEAVTEYDLRSFFYDWAHRQASGPKASRSSLPVSMKRFFRFLDADCGLECPWAWEILADREVYQVRQETWPGGLGAKAEMEDWIEELSLDLDARLFLPDHAMANGHEWGATMGQEEYALHRELRRRWLLWREEVIASGVNSPPEVYQELERRQRAWELAPHPGHKGRSPLEVITRERNRAKPR